MYNLHAKARCPECCSKTLNIMSYYFNKVLTTKNFDQAIEEVTAELKTEGFGVLTEIDVKETLKKKIDVDFDLADSRRLKTDRHMLQLIIRNLISNAVEYTPEKGSIRIASGKQNHGIVSITNSVNGLKPEDVPHLTERFWRQDESRTGDTHSGLGLSVAAACANRLNLTLDATLEEEKRLLTFRIEENPADRENHSDVHLANMDGG